MRKTAAANTRLQIAHGRRSSTKPSRYKMTNMAWLYRNAGLTGFGKSSTGINHCRQYILVQSTRSVICNWQCQGTGSCTPETYFFYKHYTMITCTNWLHNAYSSNNEQSPTASSDRRTTKEDNMLQVVTAYYSMKQTQKARFKS